jgi:hypothetical protein
MVAAVGNQPGINLKTEQVNRGKGPEHNAMCSGPYIGGKTIPWLPSGTEGKFHKTTFIKRAAAGGQKPEMEKPAVSLRRRQAYQDVLLIRQTVCRRWVIPIMQKKYCSVQNTYGP